MNRTKLKDMYIDWCNNFLTLERFADYYGLKDKYQAHRIVNVGRKLYRKSTGG